MAKAKKNAVKKHSTAKKKSTSTKRKVNKKAIIKKENKVIESSKKQEESITKIDKPEKNIKIEKNNKITKDTKTGVITINKIGFIERIKNSIKRFTNKRSNAKKIAKIKKSSFQRTLKKNLRKIKMYGLTSVVPLKYMITAGLTFIVVLIAIVSIMSLLHKSFSINLNNVPNKIDQITTVSFNIDDSNDIVTSSKAYSGLKDYYEYDFQKVFELDKSYVKNYVIKYNKTNGQIFIVLKATDGNEEKLKEVFDNFLSKNKITDYLYKEYQGYQIYIKSSSKDNDAIVLSKIMQSNIRVFTILQELKADDIEKTFGIKSSYYEEALVKTSMLRSDTCQYLIIKPVNNNARIKIKNAMEDYYAGLELKWQGKDQNNYDLVINRHFEEYEGYLIYLVSNDNNLVMELIKG